MFEGAFGIAFRRALLLRAASSADVEEKRPALQRSRRADLDRVERIFDPEPVEKALEAHIGSFAQTRVLMDARFLSSLSFHYPNRNRPTTINDPINGMPVGSGQKEGTSEFLFSAMEKPSGHVRGGVFITSDPVGAGGIRETEQFLRFAIANGMGVKNSADFAKVAIAGRSFYQGRVNIPGTVTIYGAQLATECNSHFLVFWFSAASPRELESLVQSLNGMEMTCSPSAGGDR